MQILNCRFRGTQQTQPEIPPIHEHRRGHNIRREYWHPIWSLSIALKTEIAGVITASPKRQRRAREPDYHCFD